MCALRDNIKESWYQNKVRIATSTPDRALEADIEMFSEEAWVELPDRRGRERLRFVLAFGHKPFSGFHLTRVRLSLAASQPRQYNVRVPERLVFTRNTVRVEEREKLELRREPGRMAA